MKKKALFISLVAHPGKRDDLWALWQERMIPHLTVVEEAIIIPCFDREDGDVIRLFELFENEEVPNAILRADWFRAFFEEVAPLLKMSEVHVADPVWEKR